MTIKQVVHNQKKIENKGNKESSKDEMSFISCSLSVFKCRSAGKGSSLSDNIQSRPYQQKYDADITFGTHTNFFS
jgi:hypothetical protein